MIYRYNNTQKIGKVAGGGNLTDSGWVDIEWTSDFKDYGDLAYNGAQVRRIGNMVYLRGVATPTHVVPGAIYITRMGNLPSGFRPDINVQFVCQGSGANRYMLSVYTDGNFGASRYGTSEMSDIPTSAWLPFNISYVAGDNQ